MATETTEERICEVKKNLIYPVMATIIGGAIILLLGAIVTAVKEQTIITQNLTTEIGKMNLNFSTKFVEIEAKVEQTSKCVSANFQKLSGHTEQLNSCTARLIAIETEQHLMGKAHL